MARKHETEVMVVGAGPVGMLAALMLVEREVQVEIIDEEWRPAARSYALALHPRALELLDEVGLARELLKEGHRLHRVAFYDGAERRAEVSLAELSGAYPFLLVLPQKSLEGALEHRLRHHDIDVRWNHKLAGLSLDGDQPVATVEKLAKESTGYSVATTVWVVEDEIVTAADFVVGADGHRSAVRRALGVDFESLGEPELYAVFEITVEDGPHLDAMRDEVRVVLDQGTTNVLWPLGGGRFRWSFQVKVSTMGLERPDKSRLAVQVGRHAYPYLTREDLEGLIRVRAPWFDAAVGEVPWSVAVQFERRLAASFGRGGVWLAGDAAHLALPVGVHSMNLGLAEAHDLADRMARVLRKGAPRSEVEAYGPKHRAVWQRLLEDKVEAGPEATEWAREHRGHIVPCLPAAGEDLGRLAGQLGLRPG
jgi:pentachlorophenol monooxygenase